MGTTSVSDCTRRWTNRNCSEPEVSLPPDSSLCQPGCCGGQSVLASLSFFLSFFLPPLAFPRLLSRSVFAFPRRFSTAFFRRFCVDGGYTLALYARRCARGCCGPLQVLMDRDVAPAASLATAPLCSCRFWLTVLSRFTVRSLRAVRSRFFRDSRTRCRVVPTPPGGIARRCSSRRTYSPLPVWCPVHRSSCGSRPCQVPAALAASPRLRRVAGIICTPSRAGLVPLASGDGDRPAAHLGCEPEMAATALYRAQNSPCAR